MPETHEGTRVRVSSGHGEAATGRVCLGLNLSGTVYHPQFTAPQFPHL